MTNGWKITAIIFIVLFVLETLFLIWSYNIGTETMNNDVKCSSEVCFNKQASSYIYDDTNNICKCYSPAGEVIYQEVFK